MLEKKNTCITHENSKYVWTNPETYNWTTFGGSWYGISPFKLFLLTSLYYEREKNSLSCITRMISTGNHRGNSQFGYWFQAR